MTDNKSRLMRLTGLAVLCTVAALARPQEASAVTIEQQINIIDQEYSSGSTDWNPTDNSLGLVYWDEAKYTGATVYFEAVIKCTGCLGGTLNGGAALFTDTGSQVTSSEVLTTSSSYVRVRSNALTLTDGEEYSVRLRRRATSGGTAYAIAARLIIVQTDASAIDDTVTQIELGSADTTTSTTYEAPAGQKIYYYDSSKLDGTVTAYFESSIKTATGSSSDAGPNDCADAAHIADAAADWSTDTEGCGSNGTYASASVIGTGTSDYLQITDFGFNIPAGSEIVGITVNLEHVAVNDGSNTVTDLAARIVKDGTIGSTDNSVGAWPTTEDTTAYGGVSELWGETWEASDINATNFGFAIAIQGSSSSGNKTVTGSVDHATITVRYTPPGVMYAQLYNMTDTAAVANSEISTSSSSWSRQRSSAVTLTTGKEYVAQIKSSDDSITGSIANAKLIIEQDGGGSGLDKVQVVHQYNNTDITDADSTYTAQSFPNELDKANNWDGGTFAGYFESTLKTSAGTGYAQLDTPIGEVTTTETAYDRVRSSDIWSSLPGTATDIDVEIKNSATNTTTSASSWLIIEGSGLNAGGGGQENHADSAFFLF